MSTSINAALGVAFLVLAFLATYSMFHMWGYPYDKEKHKSSCPQWKMNIHRGIGFAYLAIYVVLMVQMVPRLWTYQVEFPARTVAHLMLGMGIGIILLIKISIIRFFRHLEELMPALGITLLVFTVLLSGLSLPFVFKERALAAGAAGGSVVSAENLRRTREQLAKIDFGGTQVDVDELATEKALMEGREVLLGKCVYCHDLKTAISKPRTSGDWWRVVKRMADKPTLGPQLSLEDQQLVAITPELQDSMQDKRDKQQKLEKAAAVLQPAAAAVADAGPAADDGGAAAPSEPAEPKVDLAKAKASYEDLCSQCHELSDVDDEPPTTIAETKELITRMVDNGMEAEPAELKAIEAYLLETFVNKK
jgi:mono/diheme cytochrome c family protein